MNGKLSSHNMISGVAYPTDREACHLQTFFSRHFGIPEISFPVSGDAPVARVSPIGQWLFDYEDHLSHHFQLRRNLFDIDADSIEEHISSIRGLGQNTKRLLKSTILGNEMFFAFVLLCYLLQREYEYGYSFERRVDIWQDLAAAGAILESYFSSSVHKHFAFAICE